MSAALPSHTLSPALPSPHRYDSRGWCNFERAEGQLIKPDTLCIDIGLFTVDMACEKDKYGEGPLRIGEACTSLVKLNLFECNSLVSLPDLSSLKNLSEINLFGCYSLVSLPDLSSLKSLEVIGLAKHLEPWRMGGFKAWDLKAQQAGA